MVDVPLEVPLGALALGRLGQCDDLDLAGTGSFRDPLDHAALAGRPPTLEDDQDPEPLVGHPVLELHQLLLEAGELGLVVARPEPTLARVVLLTGRHASAGRVVGSERKLIRSSHSDPPRTWSP